MKSKVSFLIFFMLLCALSVPVWALSDDDFTVNNIQNFDVYLPNSILFQLDSVNYNYVSMEPVNSTVVNGTAASMWIAPNYGGKFVFTAQENATVLFHETIGGVKWNGGAIGEGIFASIVSGTTYTLEWGYTVTPILPFSFILGMVGVCMGLGGPFYIIYEWRDNKDIKGMIAATVIMLVGYALIIGWLFT